MGTKTSGQSAGYWKNQPLAPTKKKRHDPRCKLVTLYMTRAAISTSDHWNWISHHKKLVGLTRHSFTGSADLKMSVTVFWQSMNRWVGTSLNKTSRFISIYTMTSTSSDNNMTICIFGKEGSGLCPFHFWDVLITYIWKMTFWHYWVMSG